MAGYDLGATCELAPEPTPRSVEAAEEAGLRFSSDCQPGIRRISGPDGFSYRRDGAGRPSAEDRRRIDALRIPPAWTRVWICEDARGHLQATGFDARGRKQYRYHADWQRVRDAAKYDRLVDFGRSLPAVRAAVDRDLRRPAVDRRRVLALVAALMDRTLVRVGNAEYLRANDSFGLTTLKDRHAEISGTRVRLMFRGKAGKESELTLDDARLARALRRARDLPGEELFQYVDAQGRQRVVESGDVNGYLREAAGREVTSKDFRTWGGSLTAALALLEAAREHGEPRDRHVSEAIKRAAGVLGNTPAVCRKSYVHPQLIELYLSGRFAEEWERARRRAGRQAPESAEWLGEEERAFLALMTALAHASGKGS